MGTTSDKILNELDYWDVRVILPFQRNFNFINGERSIGKTYSTQKFLLNEAIKKHKEFVYLIRTQDEKKSMAFEQAFNKVCALEFSDYEINFNSENCWLSLEDGLRAPLGYCLALTEAAKAKRKSFPNVYYILFDEYMIEEGQGQRYINGWKEPESFLSIYHTVDREEDRVKCFLLGNNTSFYNPYHMHPAFNIPNIEKGKTWYSDNVLFQWAVGSPRLKERKANSKFLQMIKNTEYEHYAVNGDYSNDNPAFIEAKPDISVHYFNVSTMSKTFGIWYSRSTGSIYISAKFDPSCKYNFALDVHDHSEDTTLIKNKNHPLLQWLSRSFKHGMVKFESMEVKKLTERAIINIL